MNWCIDVAHSFHLNHFKQIRFPYQSGHSVLCIFLKNLFTLSPLSRTGFIRSDVVFSCSSCILKSLYSFHTFFAHFNPKLQPCQAITHYLCNICYRYFFIQCNRYFIYIFRFGLQFTRCIFHIFIL